MSESLDKVAHLREIPIFPLPLVLLPNEILPLHIFEPRYARMLQDIEDKGKIFGVSFFDPETDFGNPPVGSVGCTTEVQEAHSLPDERSNIITCGLVRYRIVEYVDAGLPYLTAEVAYFEDDAEDPSDLKKKADHVFAIFERIAQAAFRMSGNRGRFPEIPNTDPQALSFLVTAAFNLENPLKYELLSMASTSARLERLRDILEQAVSQIEESAELVTAAQANGHSKKKLDL